MANITNARIVSFIDSLELERGGALHDLFNRLLLIDSGLYKRLIDRLVEGSITVNDLSSLQVINDITIENFLANRASPEIINLITKRQEYINILNNSFSFNTARRTELSSFSEYLHKFLINDSNYFTSIKIDSTKLSSNSFLNFSEAESLYLSLVGFRTLTVEEMIAGVDFRLADEILEVKFRHFISLHNSFIYTMPGLHDLLIQAIRKPIFLQSIFNPLQFNRFPVYSFLLRGLHQYTSPMEFDKVHRDVLVAMVSNYDLEIIKTGWTGLSGLISASSWNDMKTIITPRMTEKISPLYTRLRMLRIFYPLMYGPNYHANIININAERAIHQEFSNYFSAAADVLTTICHKIRVGFPSPRGGGGIV